MTNAAAENAASSEVLPVTFKFRKAHLMAVVDETLKGKAGHEINPEIEPEIAKIWAEVENDGHRQKPPRMAEAPMRDDLKVQHAAHAEA